MRLRSLLVMLVISLFLAFALEPAANLPARRSWRRGLATAGFLNDALGTELSGDQLAADLRDNAGVQDFVRGLAAGAVGLSTTVVGLVLQGLTIGLFTFYLVARPGRGAVPARPRPLGGAGVPVRAHRRHLPGRRLPVLIALLDQPVDARVATTSARSRSSSAARRR